MSSVGSRPSSADGAEHVDPDAGIALTLIRTRRSFEHSLRAFGPKLGTRLEGELAYGGVRGSWLLPSTSPSALTADVRGPLKLLWLGWVLLAFLALTLLLRRLLGLAGGGRGPDAGRERAAKAEQQDHGGGSMHMASPQ